VLGVAVPQALVAVISIARARAHDRRIMAAVSNRLAAVPSSTCATSGCETAAALGSAVR
jgi:hypothetical protein